MEYSMEEHILLVHYDDDVYDDDDATATGVLSCQIK